MSVEDNYNQHHQCTTAQEQEHHIDHNKEITTIIRQIIKETATRITNITVEIQVTTETISIEVEQTATTETLIIIDITIVDQAQDTQIAVNQDTNHRITEIMTITVIIIITYKDLIAEIQIELIDTDKDQIAITDIIQTITIETIEEIRHIESKITDINQKTEEQMETNNNNKNNKGRINNIETDRQNEDPAGIDEYEYTSESSNEDQELLDNFYDANEDTCNTIVNALESNPTWILPMYQCNKFEHDFTKQKPVLEIDFLLDSGATLNLFNEDTWNEIKNNNSDVHLERANKTLTAANNTTIETFGTKTLNLAPDRISNNKNKVQHNFNIHFYVTQCNHNILGTPFFKEYIETINVNTNKLTKNTNTFLDNAITFYMNSTKGYPYYSRLYPIYNKESIYLEKEQHRCITFPIPIFRQMEKSNGKTIYSSNYYFEPINKYHNLSFTNIKDLTTEKEHFMDIFFVKKSTQNNN